MTANSLTSPFVKVIAGIANTEWSAVEATIVAANQAYQHNPAIALDVAANLTQQARQAFSGTLFASSVVPSELAQAVAHGADIAELGNYDALYERGEFYSAQQVASLAKETIALVNAANPQALVCVTIPGHLDSDSQRALANDCKAMGVSFLQTEGAARLLSDQQTVAPLSTAEKAELTLSNTDVLAGILPVISASGITADNAGRMITAGAAGVGIGAAIRQATNPEAAITQLATVIAAHEAAMALAS